MSMNKEQQMNFLLVNYLLNIILMSFSCFCTLSSPSCMASILVKMASNIPSPFLQFLPSPSPSSLLLHDTVVASESTVTAALAGGVSEIPVGGVVGGVVVVAGVVVAAVFVAGVVVVAGVAAAVFFLFSVCWGCRLFREE